MTFTIDESVLKWWPVAAGVAWFIIAVLVARWLFRWFDPNCPGDHEMAAFAAAFGGIVWPIIAAMFMIFFIVHFLVIRGNSK
jgi:hypothetical protein